MTKRKKPKARAKAKPKRREIKLDELKSIVERASSGALSAEDVSKLSAAVNTLAYLTQELETKGTSIKRLRKMLFGASTEKTSRVVGKGGGEPAAAEGGAAEDGANDDATAKDAKKDQKKKRKGHGRNGAADYRGADKRKVDHESLRKGDTCPACDKGKVYPQAKPAVLVRVTGMAPLSATVYELERLRCNLCGEVFTAKAPAGVGEAKYDETAASMISLLKYGCGLPFNRIEGLERNLGIPMPASTQWDVVLRAAELLGPAYEELVRQAAQGEVLHNDDTTMRILELEALSRQAALSGQEKDERTGIFTSGIVATGEGRQIALFFTGRKHAGENLADVLSRRAAERSPPIQMCDALSRNTTGDFKTILANCNSHARRRFVEVVDNFPDECRHVLEELGKVYKNDAMAKKEKMSPDERLRFHQAESGPVIKALKKWMREQVEQKKVEPNSGLGEAMAYMKKHWQELTLFLREPGAPLDNNICERALKKVILHRKNAYFYKTENGARVGDLFMSLIHTAELGGVDSFDYLIALQRHADQVAESPADWMPWSYQATIERPAAGVTAAG